jgi:hypothetical protein
MIDDMIKRVAWVIAAKERTWRGASMKEALRAVEKAGGPTALHRRQARAAIKAMREPTLEMVKASWEEDGADIWRNMIDAALEPK